MAQAVASCVFVSVAGVRRGCVWLQCCWHGVLVAVSMPRRSAVARLGTSFGTPQTPSCVAVVVAFRRVLGVVEACGASLPQLSLSPPSRICPPCSSRARPFVFQHDVFHPNHLTTCTPSHKTHDTHTHTHPAHHPISSGILSYSMPAQRRASAHARKRRAGDSQTRPPKPKRTTTVQSTGNPPEKTQSRIGRLLQRPPRTTTMPPLRHQEHGG